MTQLFELILTFLKACQENQTIPIPYKAIVRLLASFDSSFHQQLWKSNLEFLDDCLSNSVEAFKNDAIYLK